MNQNYVFKRIFVEILQLQDKPEWALGKKEQGKADAEEVEVEDQTDVNHFMTLIEANASYYMILFKKFSGFTLHISAFNKMII